MIRNFLTVSLIIFNLGVYAKTLNGAGASFPYPIYSKWFSEYRKIDKQARFNYKPIGSGGGVRQLRAETVDFGASDVPLSLKDKKNIKFPVLQVPTVIGAIVLAYNIPAQEKLTLDAELISEIFLGKITKWNDPKIKKLNPKINLPKEDIALVQRADSSGTTAVFTSYLSEISSTWKNEVGEGKSVKWPTGIKAKGNDGVTNIISSTSGSIGYIELAYAINNNLKYASIINKNGIKSDPTLSNVSKSATALVSALSSGKQKELTGKIVNSGEGSAYPISSLTYFLIPKSNKNEHNNETLKKFLNWAMDSGSDMALKMHYAPLPSSLKALIKKEVNKL